MHYYQFNIGDYTSHTAHLDEIEDLAYRRMIDYCYLNECGLPESVSEVARVIRMRTHSECIANVLREFFYKNSDATWRHKRIDEEIAAYKGKSAKASSAARKRWGNADANALPTDSERNANHKPLTINQEPVNSKKPTRSKAGISLSDYLNECKEKGIKPISSDDPLFTYCEQAGIPDDYTALAWRVFKDAHLTKNKRYVDWKAAFRNAVKQDWYKLWAIDRDGNFYLTTAGKQAESAHFGDKK